MEETMRRCELAILGGGPAALQAGLYAASEGMDAQVILRGKPGGQIVQTPRLENLMGQHPHGISGKEFIGETMAQCRDMGVQFVKSETGATKLIPQGSGWLIRTDDHEWEAIAVVIAVGTTWLPHEAVRECALSHRIYYGPYYTRTVPKGHYAVIGSANSAAQGILELAQRGCQVTVLCRHKLECSEYLAARITKHPLINVLTFTQCKYVDPGTRPAGKYCLQLDPAARLWADGVFVMAGQKPNTDFLRDSPVKLDEHGYIMQERLCTNLPGLYVAGDCHDDIERRSLGNALGDANLVFTEAWGHIRKVPSGQSVSDAK